jgi:PUA domain protein
MKARQRHFVRKDEIAEIKETLREHYSEDFIKSIFPEKCKVEIIITEDDDELYAVNNELALWKSGENYIPVLTLLLDNRVGLKTVVVDMGAVKFVTNGADIMRPGIVKIDSEIEKGNIVRIADEDHNRTLAVGEALYDAGKMEAMDKGKVIKNLHTIQDSVWDFAKKF